MYKSDGGKETLWGLAEAERTLLLWLELGKEPTEHILNEMWERREQFAKLTAPVYFVIRKGVGYEKDTTLGKVREALPHIPLLFDDFGASYEALARRVKRIPGKLPLAVVLEKGNECIFSDSGYNVGMADLLLRILA